jgi:hypothetical protein
MPVEVRKEYPCYEDEIKAIYLRVVANKLQEAVVGDVVDKRLPKGRRIHQGGQKKPACSSGPTANTSSSSSDMELAVSDDPATAGAVPAVMAETSVVGDKVLGILLI